jgi:beta-lactamase superfamily II metal-dependent hydrolase
VPESARLEIHELDVGQGDSVLIVNRDLGTLDAAIKAEIAKRAHTAAPMPQQPDDPIDWMPYAIAQRVPLAGTVAQALLVDGGDYVYGTDVVGYLEAHGVLVEGTVWTPHLAVLVSHFHDDHMAGLRSVFRKPVTGANGKVRVVERYRPRRIYQGITGPDTDPDTARFAAFQGDIDAAVGASPNPAQLFSLDPGGLINKAPAVISLGQGAGNIPIDVHVVASGQGVYDKATKKVIEIESRRPGVIDQNDRSVVLVVEYGSFRYFLGGDIGGDGGPKGGNTGDNAASTTEKKYYSQHADVESVLGPALERRFPATKPAEREKDKPKFPHAGYCTVMKADHHGSSSSVDVYFLATIRPVVMLISSGLKARFHEHPTQQVINRATAATTKNWQSRPVNNKAVPPVPNSIGGIYITEVVQEYKDESFDVDIESAAIVGDIVVRPVDETVVAVQEEATATMQQLVFQVYGTGAQTDLTDEVDRALRPVDFDHPGGMYPVGPEHYSDQH